jgi:branched-subunit amino acid permease
MGPGEWIALSGIVLTAATLAAGGIYRLGQVMGELRELARRVERIEGKLDRVPKRRPPEHVG